MGWTENQVDLADYAGKNVLIGLATEDRSSCSEYFWADPVLICSNKDLQGSGGAHGMRERPGAKPTGPGIKSQ